MLKLSAQRWVSLNTGEINILNRYFYLPTLLTVLYHTPLLHDHT